ncbi:hypothetical protein CF645_37240, partial [Burkholderia pseudomallei]
GRCVYAVSGAAVARLGGRGGAEIESRLCGRGRAGGGVVVAGRGWAGGVGAGVGVVRGRMGIVEDRRVEQLVELR